MAMTSHRAPRIDFMILMQYPGPTDLADHRLLAMAMTSHLVLLIDFMILMQYPGPTDLADHRLLAMAMTSHLVLLIDFIILAIMRQRLAYLAHLSPLVLLRHLKHLFTVDHQYMVKLLHLRVVFSASATLKKI